MSAAALGRHLRQLFIVPELEGRPTGGTVYNRRLLFALAELAAPAQAMALETLPANVSRDVELAWLDSLYLEHASKVKARFAESTRLGLMLHYLPSLVAHGASVTDGELSRAERLALEVADVALVTGRMMQEVVRRLRPGLPCLYVAPGSEYRLCLAPPRAESGLSALLVAHVVPGKGIFELLAALLPLLVASDRLTLRVVGDLTADVDYAARCRALVRSSAPLRERVSFSGLLQAPAVAQAFCAANLFVSASVMESYGMALADARRAGLPILARDAGNVSQHAEPASGGELVPDADGLARALLALARNSAEHARRLEAARQLALPARPWSDAARELLVALQSLAGSC